MQSRFDSLGTGPVHAVLEATGTYSDAVALYLYERGHRVSVINPARLAAFRKSEGVLTKTDKQDAKLLVRYCQQKQPPTWTPPPEELRQVQVLELRREQVQQMRQQEANHLENSRLDAQTCQQITTHLAQLDAQIAELEERAATLVSQHEELRSACDLLDSIPSMRRSQRGACWRSSSRLAAVSGLPNWWPMPGWPQRKSPPAPRCADQERLRKRAMCGYASGSTCPPYG